MTVLFIVDSEILHKTRLTSASDRSSKLVQLLHCRVLFETLELISHHLSAYQGCYLRCLSFSSKPRMKSAPSPSAPRGLCAWSAITAALALNV
jgi:hypothetical protein